MFRWVDHLGGIANSQPYCDDKLIKQPLLLHFDLGVFDFMFAGHIPTQSPSLCALYGICNQTLNLAMKGNHYSRSLNLKYGWCAW